MRLSLPVLRKGKCDAIAWWFELSLDDETSISVAPGASVRTWKQNLFHVQESFRVKRGETIEALVWMSNDDQIYVVGGRPGVRRPASMKGSSEAKLEPTWLARDAAGER